MPQSAGSVVLSNGNPTTTLHMDLSFAAGVTDRWAYPQLNLAQPQNPSWANLQYILIRARAGQSSAVRIFVVESGGAFYYTANPIIPADGQYHTALIPFSALTVAGGHPADPDGKLDPEQITAIQIGMNSDTTTNTLDVSDYYIVTTPTAGLAVEQPAGTALTNATSTIDFGSAVLNTSSTRTFVVRNTGTTTLTAVSASVSGTNAADFGVTTPPPATLAGGASGTFVVTFSPLQNEARTAVLHVASNTAGANAFDINLKGFGYSITAAPQNVSAAGATLEGTFNPNGVQTTVYFQYGTTTSYENTTTTQDIGNGSSSVNFSAPLNGLTSSTTYHVRAVVVAGGVTTYGVDQTFTTPLVRPGAARVGLGHFGRRPFDRGEPAACEAGVGACRHAPGP
ncbi:MAG: choice-of-anchor D domain-containing protein [Chthoniobacter sp.]